MPTWDLRKRADRNMHAVANQMLTQPLDEELAAMSRRNLGPMIEDLRASETSIRKLRKRVEALQAKDARLCPGCGQPVTGRPDAIYCSTTCRVRAHRASRGR